MYRLLVFLLLCWPLHATLPEINSKDAASILERMMEAHVSCKQIDAPLIKRALGHYLELLDPNKTYLTREQVNTWLSPSAKLLKAAEKQITEQDFSFFFTIHEAAITALKEQEPLYARAMEMPLLEDPHLPPFETIDWAEHENALLERLRQIRALQAAAMETLVPESRDLARKRLDKRRHAHKEELCCDDPLICERYVLTGMLKAFASAFDAHTNYFTPNEATQFMIQVQQRLFGIGVQLRDDLNGFTIVDILKGGPAERAHNLQVNDTIVAVDEEPVVGLEITEAVALIRGEKESPVQLTILRGAGERHDVTIQRGEVIIHNARIHSKLYPFADGVIAHISLHSFYQDPLLSSAVDLAHEIEKIEREYSLKGVLLDLRTNSGGILPQAVAVTSLFITKGIVVSIKDNRGVIEHLRDMEGKVTYDGPLIVMTSKMSASAAEIVAQTLQDYGRALVVGDAHTYGKGSFQTFTLDGMGSGRVNPKGEFKVTRGTYYTVSGKSPQLVGVTPDVEVPGLYSSMEIGERYAKNPLPNDSIPANYDDTLSDIPLLQRNQVRWLYHFNLQPKMRKYHNILPQLTVNSSGRTADDTLYQKFLTLLDDEKPDHNQLLLLSQHDFQLQESLNIMRDLIMLLPQQR